MLRRWVPSFRLVGRNLEATISATVQLPFYSQFYRTFDRKLVFAYAILARPIKRSPGIEAPNPPALGWAKCDRVLNVFQLYREVWKWFPLCSGFDTLTPVEFRELVFVVTWGDHWNLSYFHYDQT